MDDLPCLILSQEFRAALLRLPPSTFNVDPATVDAPPTPGPQPAPDAAHATTHWPLLELFSAELDRHDARMTDNLVAVLTAVFTGLAMLLLVDLLFRVVVRSSGDPDPRKLRLHALLSAVANPIGWLGDLGRSLMDGKVARVKPSGKPADRTGQSHGTRIPSWMRALVVVSGLTLIAVDLLLLFLLCTHERNVPVDRAALPAFKFAEPNTTALLVQQKPLCDSRPVTRRDGFRSLATVYTCAFSTSRDFAPLQRADLAFVGASWGFKRVVFDVLTKDLASTYLQEVFIGLDNGTQYTVEPVVSASDVARVLPIVLQRRNLRVLRTIELPRPPRNGSAFMQWSALYMLDMRDVQVPRPFSDALRAGLDLSAVAALGAAARASIERNLYVAAVARSSLALSARARAFHRDPDNGPFLDDGDVPLVRTVGPRLGVRDSAGVCMCVFIVWFAVAFVARWGGGFDARLLLGRTDEHIVGHDLVSPSSSVESIEDGLEKSFTKQ